MNLSREQLIKSLTFQNTSEQADLLDPDRTHDNLINLLSTAVGQGHRLVITSVRTDHGDDSSLGPHSHSAGYAVDLWPSDNLLGFLQDCATHNPFVTKIGLGGDQAQALINSFGYGNTIVFNDNSTDHIHLQTD